MENDKTPGLQKRPRQVDRVLRILENQKRENINGGWVDGMIFFHLSPAITQYHTRIWELQQLGYVIEGRFVAGKNWKEYRLVDGLGK